VRSKLSHTPTKQLGSTDQVHPIIAKGTMADLLGWHQAASLALFPTRLTRLALTLVAVVILMSSPKIATADSLDEKSYQTLSSWLDAVLERAPIKIRPQRVVPLADDKILSVFPDDRFYAVSFATWPIAPRLPSELSHQMVARVAHGESVQPIRDKGALIEFLTQALAGVRGEDRVRAIALASLRLAEAVAKGGSHTFDNPDVSVARQEGRIVATARASAEEPGRGEVTIQMQFGLDGTILPDGVNIEDRTSRGPPSRS